MIATIKNIISHYLFNLLIYFLAPHKKAEDNSVGITSLVCHRDVKLFIVAVQSFYYALGKVLPLYIIDDGSLTFQDKNLLKKLLPVYIEPLESNDKKMKQKLNNFRSVYRFRFDPEATIVKKKIDCLILNPFGRFIYIDSDVLFHRRPTEIIKWLEEKQKKTLINICHDHMTKYFTTDLEFSENFFRSLLLKYLSMDGYPLFNLGLLCVSDKQQIDLRKLNSIIDLFYEVKYVPHAWNAEEAALMTLWDRRNKDIQTLPRQYYLNTHILSEYNLCKDEYTKFVHYIAGMKKKFLSDSIKLMIKTNFFSLETSKDKVNS